MPQIGNKKFPYTPSGMKRANQLRKKIRGAMRPQGDNVRRADAPSSNIRRDVSGTNQRRQASTAIDPSVGKGADNVANPPRMPERTPPPFGGPTTKPMPRPGGSLRPKPVGQRPRPSFPGRPGRPGRPFPRPSFPGRPGPNVSNRPRPGGNTWGLRPLPNKPPARPGMGNQRRPKPKNLKRFM